VLGEFKRGKSTLLDALVGEALLPTGVIPVTAVPTEVSYGPPGITVVHFDGTRRPLGSGEDLADFVTESRNPANARQVARVEVQREAPLLATGLVLVDTPGIGSIHTHSDLVAGLAVKETDAAMVVLSADAPFSERELTLLKSLAARQSPTFFVLNKIDHLSGDELDQMRQFVSEAISANLGRPTRLFCVAALPALKARQSKRTPGPEAGEFSAFEEELSRFARADMASAGLKTARNELARLAEALAETLDLAEAALRLDVETLADRAQRFHVAASEEVRAFADERLLFARDVATLAERVAADLVELASRVEGEWAPRMRSLAQSAPVRRLDDELSRLVIQAIEEGFEVVRKEETHVVDVAWHELAEGLRATTESRVNELRTLAASLFDVSLPHVSVGDVSEERERFFSLVLRVDASGETVVRLFSLILPQRSARRMILRRSLVRLRAELEKHSGRARSDLAQRIDTARRRFEKTMAAELDRTAASIAEAARRATTMREKAELEQNRQRAEDERARQAIKAARALAAQR
jgi:GTP-binding protein EngB required for normal cell division